MKEISLSTAATAISDTERRVKYLESKGLLFIGTVYQAARKALKGPV